jgi:hypothetical protein
MVLLAASNKASLEMFRTKLGFKDYEFNEVRCCSTIASPEYCYAGLSGAQLGVSVRGLRAFINKFIRTGVC